MIECLQFITQVFILLLIYFTGFFTGVFFIKDLHQNNRTNKMKKLEKVDSSCLSCYAVETLKNKTICERDYNLNMIKPYTTKRQEIKELLK